MRPRKPSPAMIIAILALVFAMAGTGMAARAYLITSSSQIRNGVVTGADVRDTSLTGVDVRNGTLTGRDIRDGSLSLRAFTGTLPAGPQGPPGVAGAAGSPGQSLYAGVAAGLPTGNGMLDPLAFDYYAPIGASTGSFAEGPRRVLGPSTPMTVSHFRVATDLPAADMAGDTSRTFTLMIVAQDETRRERVKGSLECVMPPGADGCESTKWMVFLGSPVNPSHDSWREFLVLVVRNKTPQPQGANDSAAFSYQMN